MARVMVALCLSQINTQAIFPDDPRLEEAALA